MSGGNKTERKYDIKQEAELWLNSPNELKIKRIHGLYDYCNHMQETLGREGAVWEGGPVGNVNVRTDHSSVWTVNGQRPFTMFYQEAEAMWYS